MFFFPFPQTLNLSSSPLGKLFALTCRLLLRCSRIIAENYTQTAEPDVIPFKQTIIEAFLSLSPESHKKHEINFSFRLRKSSKSGNKGGIDKKGRLRGIFPTVGYINAVETQNDFPFLSLSLSFSFLPPEFCTCIHIRVLRSLPMIYREERRGEKIISRTLIHILVFSLRFEHFSSWNWGLELVLWDVDFKRKTPSW